jgi:hypothetical protein
MQIFEHTIFKHTSVEDDDDDDKEEEEEEARNIFTKLI